MFDPGTTGIIVMAFLFVTLAIGIHIGVALRLSGLLGMTLTIGAHAALAQLATVPFAMTIAPPS